MATPLLGSPISGSSGSQSETITNETDALTQIGAEVGANVAIEQYPDVVVDGFIIFNSSGETVPISELHSTHVGPLYLSGSIFKKEKSEQKVTPPPAATAAEDVVPRKKEPPSKRVEVSRMGPIQQWWVCGFDAEDGDDIIGVSTSFCSYYLRNPSAAYKDSIIPVMEEAQLLKIVILFTKRMIKGRIDVSYETLLAYIEENYHPTASMAEYTEELLIQHSQFIFDQLIYAFGTECMEYPALKMYSARCNRRYSAEDEIVAPSLKRGTESETSFSTRFFEKSVLQKRVLSKLRSVRRKSIQTTPFIKDLCSSFLKKTVHTSIKDCLFPVTDCQSLVGLCIVVKKSSQKKSSLGLVVEEKDDVCHVQLLIDSSRTLFCKEKERLREVFLVDGCKDYRKSNIVGCLAIVLSRDRSNLGQASVSPKSVLLRMKYDEESSSLSYLDDQSYNQLFISLSGRLKSYKCPLCSAKDKAKKDIPNSVFFPLDKMGDKMVHYSNCMINTDTQKPLAIRVGEAYFLHSSSWARRGKVYSGAIDIEEYFQSHSVKTVFPEFLRKFSAASQECEIDKIESSLCIGIVCDLMGPKRCGVISAKMRILYRPEDSPLDFVKSLQKPINRVYWSNDMVTVPVSQIVRRCSVYRVSCDNALEAELEWFDRPSSFFLDNDFMVTGGGTRFVPLNIFDESLPRFTPLSPIHSGLGEDERLRCLEVFSGCGGFSLGLRQSGVADVRWAIDCDDSACDSYHLNFFDTIVFRQKCESFLADILAGKQMNQEGFYYPQKGEVDLLVGSPPCQGFSKVNGNCLALSFLGFVDYYRPKYVVFENCVHFSENTVVLRLFFSLLVSMGYQCSLSTLQAACFGVPQNREHLFIIAAALGFVMPETPKPLNSFSRSSVMEALNSCPKGHSPPFRALTVYDALSDLSLLDQPLSDGRRTPEMIYHLEQAVPVSEEPLTSYQRVVRDGFSSVLTLHNVRPVSSVVMKRISFVSKFPDGSWCDLPNVAVTLPDNTVLPRLYYRVDGKHVCSCAVGKPCDHPTNIPISLIPFHYSHTGKKNKQWHNQYARLDMFGPTDRIMPYPDPTGEQGRVLHPEQDRIISVRECARCQGFPDSFLIVGTTMEQYNQIGQAVPPPLARCLGKELVKAVKRTRKQITKRAAELFKTGGIEDIVITLEPPNTIQPCSTSSSASS